MCRSVPQMPVRWTRISTSLMPIFGSGTSSSHSPGSARLLTSAFMGALWPGKPSLDLARETAEAGLDILRGGRRRQDEQPMAEGHGPAGVEREVQLFLAVRVGLRAERVGREQAVAAGVPVRGVGRVPGMVEEGEG